jgi:hypothetical protein
MEFPSLVEFIKNRHFFLIVPPFFICIGLYFLGSALIPSYRKKVKEVKNNILVGIMFVIVGSFFFSITIFIGFQCNRVEKNKPGTGC